MTQELKVPDVRDDDPEEVADKLSIAAAMWTRGDRADALTWVRRAAESASDAEADIRALDLAKAASALAASLADPAAAAAAAARPKSAPPGPPPPARPQSKLPPPKPSSKPLAAAGRPQSKLPPLPPLRPLGSAPAPMKSAIPAKPREAPSQGAIEARPKLDAPLDETQTRELELPDPRPAPSDAPTKRVREEEEEETSQIDLGPSRPQSDLDATATHDAVGEDYIRMVQQRAPSAGAIPTAAAVATVEHVPAVAAPYVPPAEVEPPREAAQLPLAIGVRVRLHTTDGGAWVVAEGESEGGIPAIIVPLQPDDDLRAIFEKKS